MVESISPDFATGAELRDVATERLKEGLKRDFGPICMNALQDPSVIELMLNPDGKVWIDVLGKGMRCTEHRMPTSQSNKLFTTIASLLGGVVNSSNPILEGELPLDGSRFEGLIQPVVARPTFAIRKKASLVFTLEDYARAGILTHRQDPANRIGRQAERFSEMAKGKSHYEIIRLAILLRKNILVVGSTGSGKTTLINAILEGIATLTGEHRILLMEDTGEVQCKARNHVPMRSCDHVDMTRLLRATMRLRPDRIIVGEVRGGEALALLKAWNTGHPGGLATIHANDSEAGLIRLEQLIEEATANVNRSLIAEAVDLVIFIDRDKSIDVGRKVRELAVVEGYDHEREKYVIHRV